LTTVRADDDNASALSDVSSYARQQQRGLAALLAMSQQVQYASASLTDTDVRDASTSSFFLRERPVGALREYRGPHTRERDRHPAAVPPREVGHRPVAVPKHAIPDVTFHPRRALGLLPVLLLAGGSVLLHRGALGMRLLNQPWLLTVWAISLVFVILQVIMAWWQRPFTVTPRQAAQLDQLRVTVVIPCYNEDAAILDRTIYSLFRQTRLPDHVVVVDDGSSVDYREVRERWRRRHPRGTKFSWVRQANAGKKHAQAAAFRTDPYADIFVTMDSDSALERRAIEEGLKPFAREEVVSVAGLEMAYNFGTNILTKAIAARSLAFQLFAMSAQSSARGNVIINPGAFSLYRAWLIRKILPAYLGETFFGLPVTLGDDTALTIFALCHGRAVHQPSAVSMPVYPEKLSHHLRQWTRWMRASTIRTFWRIRYLPMFSYGWFYVVYTQWAFFASVAFSLVIPFAWPATRNLAIASGIALIVWPWAVAVRLATVRRSDQGFFAKMAGVLLMPVAALWYLLVLRQIRFYGMATCARQHWVTRAQVEVTIGAPVPAGAVS
jgi:hyaluronan synthase